MFKYKGVNLIKTVYRPYAPLMSSLFIQGFGDSFNWHRFTGLNYKLADCLCIDGVYYYPDYHFTTFAGQVVKKIFSSSKSFLHLKRVTLAAEKKVLAVNKADNLRDFFRSYLEYMPALALYHICDDFIEEGLRVELRKKISSDETEQLMSLLNLPLKPNFDYLMKRWFLKTKDVDLFIQKYSWNFFRFGQHNFLSRQEAQALLVDWQKDKSLSGVDKNRLVTRRAIRKAKKILGEKAYYIDIMQFFIYYRTHRTDIMNKVFFSYYNKLSFFAGQLGLSYEELILCSYEELTSGKIPRKNILQSRKTAFVTCFSHSALSIISGARVAYFRKLCLDKKTTDLISGRAAFPGKVSGLVRVIKDRADFGKLNKGDILVSSMTTPSMAPIMKKAGAFVTDEGGITCHAAILAREMKKPCIIGTKNATRVLKDGDLVEVDADKGVVRIIKS